MAVRRVREAIEGGWTGCVYSTYLVDEGTLVDLDATIGAMCLDGGAHVGVRRGGRGWGHGSAGRGAVWPGGCGEVGRICQTRV